MAERFLPSKIANAIPARQTGSFNFPDFSPPVFHVFAAYFFASIFPTQNMLLVERFANVLPPDFAVSMRKRFPYFPPVSQEEKYRLVRLANGAYSVRAVAEDETFHPVIGPVAEAEALYVRQLRLPERLARHTAEFVIWDVGLGAAANVLTVLRAARRGTCPLRMLSFDRTLAPLEFGLRHANALGYFSGYEAILESLLRHKQAQFQEGNHPVTWEVRVADFPALIASPIADQFPKPHAILFDAFSPVKNPEMWTLPLFTRIYSLLDPARPCGLPTYSRSTMLRVSLLLAGFYAGAGHATGEKEETTLAANTLDLISEPLDRRWLMRAKRSTCAEPMRAPVYRKAPLTPSTWEKLLAHPQFQAVSV